MSPADRSRRLARAAIPAFRGAAGSALLASASTLGATYLAPTMTSLSITRLFAALLVLGVSVRAIAQTPPAPATSRPAVEQFAELPSFTVIGSKENLERLPGSGAFIAGSEFREPGLLVFSRITAKVPGVYVREEDGYGNFINVSIRSVDRTRSNKVTLMEDGILTAPSPYAAPAAYYSPKLGRMSGIEILKGSSQIAHGPHTTGGVVNFLSTPVPSKRAFFTRATYGSNSTFFNHTTFGDTLRGRSGAFGYLLELHHQRTDGYRAIGGTSRDSGFALTEPMLKLFWEPASSMRQRIELKLGRTDFDAHETYSGITVADLHANPDRRYAGSRFDDLTAAQWRSYLKYSLSPAPGLRLESALYHNSFERTWDKLDGLSGAGLRSNVAEALLHSPSLAVLQGTGTGSIVTRAAVRDHEGRGWQNLVSYSFATGALNHRLHAGLRLHEDSVAGTNLATTYAADGAGGFGPGTRGAVASAGVQEVTATAVFVEHAVTAGRFTFTPGYRRESLDWTNLTGGGARTTGDNSYHTAGLGATFAAETGTTLFAGAYRGISAPNPAGYTAGTVEEQSLALELGLRHRRDALRGELVLFHSDFDNMIAPQVGIGAGGVAPSTNAGSARARGVEALLEYDLGRAAGWKSAVPVHVSATWTDAEFTGLPANARLGNGAGVFAGGRNGNAIPYVPTWKLAAGAAWTADRWTARLDASYVSSCQGTGYNRDTRLADGSATPANPSALDGRIDSLLLVDFTGHYTLNDRVRLLGGVHNLFDERGMVSRVPLGPRANSPRFLFAGFEARF